MFVHTGVKVGRVIGTTYETTASQFPSIQDEFLAPIARELTPEAILS